MVKTRGSSANHGTRGSMMGSPEARDIECWDALVTVCSCRPETCSRSCAASCALSDSVSWSHMSATVSPWIHVVRRYVRLACVIYESRRLYTMDGLNEA